MSFVVGVLITVKILLDKRQKFAIQAEMTKVEGESDQPQYTKDGEMSGLVPLTSAIPFL